MIIEIYKKLKYIVSLWSLCFAEKVISQISKIYKATSKFNNPIKKMEKLNEWTLLPKKSGF